MRRLLVLAIAALAFGGCTLLTQFDPEGQPCDTAEPNPWQQCLTDAGYFCVNGSCTKKGSPPVTADGGM